jgi:hypothetical protein
MKQRCHKLAQETKAPRYGIQGFFAFSRVTG